MDDSTPIDRPMAGGILAALGERSPLLPKGDQPRLDPPEGDPNRSPDMGWPTWTAPIALLGGIVFAAVAGLLVDIPAALIFGVSISSEDIPPGLSIADTVIQDVGFVLVAIYFARLGGRVVRSWQFGLRRPGAGWRSAVGKIVLLIVVFVAVSAIWSAVFKPEEEKLLKSLGSNEGASLLVLSAALTCVVAPICEEFLFRGYVFTALRTWRGTLPAALITGLLFGGVHVGSAPVLDLIPLAALGFGLFLLYRYTGSLYPCIVAHSLNNTIAFAGLEKWNVAQTIALLVSALLSIGALALLFKRIGLIAPSRSLASAGE